MFLIIAQVANGLEQRRPENAVGTHGQQAEHDQQVAERREGRQIEAQATGAEQADGDQFAGVETVREQAADNKQRRGDDRVGAQQHADFSVAQTHEFLHGHIEGVLEVRQFVDGAATENEDQESEPFGLVLDCHCCSPRQVQALLRLSRVSSARVRNSASTPRT
ncbi:hypothetical protein D3C72_483190 [compost metagenome]